MLGAIAIFMISAAAGYLVLARATDKSGWVKGLGMVLGLAIIGTSLAAAVIVPFQMQKAARPAQSLGMGQFRPPSFSPPPMPEGMQPQSQDGRPTPQSWRPQSSAPPAAGTEKQE
jgi:hypothetical protein